MSNIGVEIQQIRLQSPYKDLRSFATRAGLSHEGLRKIEHGDRIPNRETLDSILAIGKVPAKKADELRRGRDQAQAARDGLTLPTHSSDEQIRKMAVHVVGVLEKFLSECDFEIDKESRKELLTRVNMTLRKEIRG